MYISKPTCLAVFAILPLVVACGDGAADQPPAMNSGGSAGAAQAGAAAGSAGAGGQGGAAAGSGGSGGAAGSGGSGGSGGEAPMPFVLASPDLDRHDDCTKDNKGPCDTFQTKNILDTIGGQNQSPELSWGTGPAGTMGYALVLFDQSFGNPHWVVWNLPATTHSLPANLQRKQMLDMPQGAQQKSFKPDNAYAGPGAHGNVYEFKVYALKTATFNANGDQGAIRGQLEQSQDVLGSSTLRGKSP
jgi:Raf kinase inhibitor-like YbhB/YbcL family protein